MSIKSSNPTVLIEDSNLSKSIKFLTSLQTNSLLFIEAVKSKEDMNRIIREVPGHHMINLIEDGDTPLLEINELEQIGYKIAVMPLTLMSASVKTMQECLKNMKNKVYNTNVTKFSELRDIVGFNEYYEIEDKYK